MGKLYEEIFWLNRRRNGGSTSAGMVAQSKTEWWLNLSGLGAQRTPEYSKANYASLHAEDYYKTQGLAFIMLVAALIHQEVEKATKEIDGKSLDDCLLDARMVKAHKRHGIWKLCNCLKKQVTLFKQLNTEMKVI